jgi:protein arginine kinase activator
MLCENCNLRQGRPTKFTLNGVSTVKYLCPECSSKLIKSKLSGGLFQDTFMTGISDFFEDLPQIIDSIFGVSKSEGGLVHSPYAELQCPKCKTSIQELFQTGFVGCPYCYEAFSPVMEEVVQRCQQDTVHVGKGPYGMAGLAAKYQNLSAQLKKAVAEERYEEAARIKKELEQLKGGLNAEK